MDHQHRAQPFLVVTVYTTAACAACVATKRHLRERGIHYTEVAIDSDEKILEAINELDLRTAPVVCASTVSGEQYWDGYRPDRIDALVSR